MQNMSKTESDVRTAIERCLEGCYQAQSPVVRLAEFMEELRTSGWEPADVRRVELLVLKMLARLLSPKEDLNRPELDGAT